jgi:endonuclease/exonuclease/phosphatase family metal-dependent hydrolase
MDLLVYNTHLFRDTPAALVAGADDRLRTLAIAERILEDAPDLVLLAEVWAPSTRALLRDRLAPALPASVDDGRRGLASGLMVLSKWPIQASGFEAFDACHGTGCWSAKGLLWAVVDSPDGAVLVVDTHLQAGSAPRDRSARARHVEHLGALRLRLEAQWHPTMTLIGGDLNVAERDAGLTPPVGEYAALSKRLPGLRDAWRELNTVPGYTYDAVTNPWISRFAPKEYRDAFRQRLDYVWTDAKVTKAAIPADRYTYRRRNGSLWPLSDHLPLSVTLRPPG